ncbi:putative pentatricopeptide repeat-containing protein At5g37570 [Amborella trichopoda]|uniref:putative pentatricopeptide repeat-containing protein At5g37570 n=1 Tax=Amborella trichopoda TaxID=13333 RepID=UPI0005D3BA9C|nr:putative pentatricopeptide repeat-containing protein At5g37570 [Amborella trichopoda]|eukprot:XP_011628290.1 putative pentatricopeptide repeat-containing protein At5g37570 [Amborella trichopoda]
MLVESAKKWGTPYGWSLKCKCFLHQATLELKTYLQGKALILFWLKSPSTGLKHLNRIHAQILTNGLHQDNFLVAMLVTKLIAVYKEDYARLVFIQVDHPNEFLWTSMIRGYSSKGPFREATLLYKQMLHKCVSPNNFTFPFIIKSCATLHSLAEGEQAHCHIVKLGFESNIFVQTSLLNMYSKCQRVGIAQQLFDLMTEKNVVSWTTMIAAYSKQGQVLLAWKLFSEMPERNVASWNAMIDGFIRSGDVGHARQLFDRMPLKNSISWTTMINGYSKARDLISARALFDQMGEKEVIAWTTMISGYAQNGEPGEAIKLFKMMQASGVKPDEVTMLNVLSACAQSGRIELSEWIYNCAKRYGFGSSVQVLNCVIIMFSECGAIEIAYRMFRSMPHRDVVSYNSMIMGFASHGHAKFTFALLSMMVVYGVAPNSITLTGLLTACARTQLVNEGLWFFKLMLLNKMGDDVNSMAEHYACMVDLLGRAGHLDEAHELIEHMGIEHKKASAWGALLGACKLQGNVGLAEVVAKQLFDLEPENPGNYALLANIYAEASMWDEATTVREMMKQRQVTKPVGSSRVEMGFTGDL